MKLFFTLDLEKALSSEVLIRIQEALKIFAAWQNPEIDAPQNPKQHELLNPVHSLPNIGKLYFIALRFSDAARMLVALIRPKSPEQHTYCLALEVTETHDYRNTLAGNSARRTSWIPKITAFILTDFLRPQVPEQAPKPYQIFYEKSDGHYGIADEEQLNLLRQTITQPLGVFGTAGAGKTGVGLQRLKDYAHADLHTYYFAPHTRLSRHMQGVLALHVNPKALPMQGVLALHVNPKALPLIQCISWEDFLTNLNAPDAFQPLALCPRPHQKQVDFLLFQNWLSLLTSPEKRKSQHLGRLKEKYPPSLLYQEYVHVFITPDWRRPENPFITDKTYQELGEFQSRIENTDRSDIYALFERFVAHCQSENLYEPRLIAHKLYQALHHPDRPEIYLADAICIDELHMFHPWQWACLLSTLKNPRQGFLTLLGDSFQSIDAEQQPLIRMLTAYFQAHHFPDVYMGHLSINYRSAQQVTKLASLVLEAIKATYGSKERETHTCVRLNPEAPEGRITLSTALESYQAFVARTLDCIVLTPENGPHPLWPPGQCTSLASFQGLSEKQIILYGFSAHYQAELTMLSAFFEKNPLPNWQDNLSFARRFKNSDLPLAAVRCLQVLYTAFSRSELNLIVCEETIHPFFYTLLAAIQDNPSLEETAVPQACLASPEPKPFISPQDWLNLAIKRNDEGLIDEAKQILIYRLTQDKSLQLQIKNLLKEISSTQHLQACFNQVFELAVPVRNICLASSKPPLQPSTPSVKMLSCNPVTSAPPPPPFISPHSSTNPRELITIDYLMTASTLREEAFRAVFFETYFTYEAPSLQATPTPLPLFCFLFIDPVCLKIFYKFSQKKTFQDFQRFVRKITADNLFEPPLHTPDNSNEIPPISVWEMILKKSSLYLHQKTEPPYKGFFSEVFALLYKTHKEIKGILFSHLFPDSVELKRNLSYPFLLFESSVETLSGQLVLLTILLNSGEPDALIPERLSHQFLLSEDIVGLLNPLYRSPIGLVLLDHLFKNPSQPLCDKFKTIPGDALYALHPHTNRSPMDDLTRSEHGCGFLNTASRFLDSIVNYPINFFNLHLSKLPKTMRENSAIYLLGALLPTGKPYPPHLLQWFLCAPQPSRTLLSSEHPDTQRFTAALLFQTLALPMQSPLSQQTTVFHFLCASSINFQDLYAHFKRTPGILQAITPELLYSTCQSPTSSDARIDANPLSYLVGHEIGVQILMLLLEHRSELFAHERCITSLYMSVPYNGHSKKQQRLFSVFNNLVECPGGLILLNNLFQKHPFIARACSVNALCSKHHFMGFDKISSEASIPFIFLLQSDLGCFILKTIFKENPFLISKTMEVLKQFHYKKGRFLGFLHCFCQGNVGIELLGMFLHDEPSFVQEITPEMLYFKEQDYAEFKDLCSPIQQLSKSTDGHNSLLRLFEEQPDLFEGFTEKLLNTPIVATNAAFQNRTLFRNLACSSMGAELLINFYTKNPDFLIDPGVFLPLKSASALNAFGFLSNIEDGRYLLSLLFKKFPVNIKNFPIETLFVEYYYLNNRLEELPHELLCTQNDRNHYPSYPLCEWLNAPDETEAFLEILTHEDFPLAALNDYLMSHPASHHALFSSVLPSRIAVFFKPGLLRSPLPLVAPVPSSPPPLFHSPLQNTTMESTSSMQARAL